MDYDTLKKLAKKAKPDFALHVLLIQKQGFTKAEASNIAYVESLDGLAARLGNPTRFSGKEKTDAKA